MRTFRNIVSDIVNDLRSQNLDDRYSYRYLSNKFSGNLEIFIKQDSDNRAIFNINEIWKPIHCIELSDAEYGSCSNYYDFCDVLKKSNKKIPEVYTGKYGNFIKILNLNNSLEYKQIKPFEYKDIKNREYINKKVKYFWIEDGYLFIPDSDTEEVKGFGLFKYSQEVDNFNGKCDECYKPLDSIVLAPDYIIEISKKEIFRELAGAKQLNKDENPNLNNNEK